MGYDRCLRRTNTQNQKHIRAVAVRTEFVFITHHASVQMKKRGIGINEVYDVLRCGSIVRQPEPNLAKGSLECRMERYVGGRECAVIVAINDENPELLVVTVMEIGN
jgi:hypothetical protein